MLTIIGSIILIGMFAQWLAWKQKIPSIISLLVSGFLVGPVFGILNPGEVMGQDVIFSIVEISVALILFDGAMQLKFSEFKPVSSGLKRILTLGVVIHFLLITTAAHFIMNVSINSRVGLQLNASCRNNIALYRAINYHVRNIYVAFDNPRLTQHKRSVATILS